MTERSGGAAGFDPRFDPAFQPGYRPETVKPSGIEALGAAVAGQSARTVPDPRLDAPDGTVVDPRVAGGPGPVSQTRASDSAGAAGAAGDVSHESSDEAPRRNPFVLALWALSALITLGGIGMVRWSFTLAEELQTSSTSSQADYQLSYMLQQSAPLFIVLGLAVATLAVFLHAQIWNGRRG